MLTKRCYLLVLAAMSMTAKAQTPPNRSVHLNQDTVALPFTVYRYYPFIAADINGIQGKLMFDTGAQSSIEIDDKRIQLKNGKVVGKGFVGSGQSYEISRYETLPRAILADKLKFTNPGPVTGHDFSYMNNITSDILGLIGYNFFKGHLFKLDYAKSVITFYKNTPDRQQGKDFLAGEKIVAVLDFEVRKLPNHPVIRIISSTDTVALSFDTGQLGGLYLTDEVRKKWIANGNLVYTDGSQIGEIKLFALPGGVVVSPGKIQVGPPQAASGANNAIGITETNSMTFGYGFLSQYKTVWDYDNKKLYLLQK